MRITPDPKRLILPLLFIITCIFCASTAQAQFDSADLLGTVSDTNGGAVLNATVTLKNVQTGTVATTQTDESGNYQFTGVKIGTYQVTAGAQGFSTAVVEDVEATVNARQRIDLTLTTGAVTETVVVTAATPLLETASSERGQVITREQIINLPLNGRSYADLALLSPGVRRSVLNNAGSGGRDASFNVNGLRSSLNNFVLDGVDNNSYGTSNQGFSNQVVQPSPDAVAEFKVQTNNYSAEFGRAGGAIINTSIRSGTNGFHGTAYDFIRNTALNATGFFKPLGGEKPVLIQNQFGGTFGGPISIPGVYSGRDRTFFFVDYEGFRRITKTLEFSLIPTLEQRQGIFRNAQGQPIPIRNPYTNVVYADGIIPQNQITAFSQSVFALLPAPNRSAGVLGISQNYENLPRSQFFNDKGDVKIDHTFNSRATMFVRGSMRKLNNFEAPAIPLPLGSPANANVRVINEQIAGGFTYNVRSNSVLEFRLGVSRTKAGKTPPGVGSAGVEELFGITGLPDDPSIAGGVNTQTISGFRELGRQNSNPQFQNPTVVNPRLAYTFLLGRHSLKTGYEYQRINTDVQDTQPLYGQDTYSGNFSRPTTPVTLPGGTIVPIPAANNLYNVADFLFGARSRYALANLFVAQYRQRMHFAYIQDDFNVSPKLTLNLGLRYDFATPQYEAQNRLSNFDPETNTLIQARDGSLYDRALVDPDRNNFGPRLGFAYTPTPRTVIRGGYGISYVHFNRLGGENLLAFNGPQIIFSTIDQQPFVTSGGVTTPVPRCTGNNFSGCYRPTEAGYPTGLVDPSRFTPLTARVNYTPRDTPSTYVQSYHVSVQRELVRNLLLDVAYVGNVSRNLIILADFNQARPNASTENISLQARRPIPGYSFIQASYAGGEANYNSLQIKLERRFSDGLYLLNSFTFSKAIDNAPGHLETSAGDNSRINIRDLASERALSTYDQPVNNTTSIVYELPFGRGRRFGSNTPRFIDATLGGFRLTLINTAASGQVGNLIYNAPSQFQVSTVLNYRPNIIGNLVVPSGQRTPDNYLDRNAVAIPTDRSQPFGNAGRNIVRGPAFFQTDLGIQKQFPLFNETTRLEFRAEAFNLFNHTNFAAPDTNVSNSTFGALRTAFPARELQFALKLYF
ncbi:MAG: TonB-dependent receptor [Pyrinomonadaceae bacterium MAG19_C2-C3]|nr:TonB-dependent receptor [Pyrinomonadaceae bacterium MAG19_C2-C3]